MKKTSDSGITFRLLQVAKQKNVDFKKWFQNKKMTLEYVPVSIYEILTVLPRTITRFKGERDEIIYRIIIGGDTYEHDWEVEFRGYLDEARTVESTLFYSREPELVDALGKLLLWCIEEGWVK